MVDKLVRLPCLWCGKNHRTAHYGYIDARFCTLACALTFAKAALSDGYVPSERAAAHAGNSQRRPYMGKKPKRRIGHATK